MKKVPKPVVAKKPVKPDQTGVFVGASELPKSRWQRNKKLILLSSAIVAVLVLGAITYGMVNDPPSDKAQIYTADIPESYDLMTNEQVKRRFEADTGLQYDSVEAKDINGRHLKTFKAAYSAARCFAVLLDFKKAQLAYAVAADKADGATGYEFYLDYAGVAQVNKDNKTAGAVIEKAKAAIRADTKLSAQAKQDLIDDITSKQRLQNS